MRHLDPADREHDFEGIPQAWTGADAPTSDRSNPTRAEHRGTGKIVVWDAKRDVARVCADRSGTTKWHGRSERMRARRDQAYLGL
ncbi:hypothetical protein THIOKS11260010 [Thiocapsa sp. KS1]|nr:hypothetical protein THIOKS11260010 [Thiocapsa sp. KS1]